MDKLKETFRKKGFDFKQVERTETWAIYEKSRDGQFLIYEVFKVVVIPERIMFGNKVLEHEAYPGDEAFGLWAWTTPALERARVITTEYERKENSPGLPAKDN